ncbi:ABC transporter permease [Pseudochryseolinea flava]|uniref:ABC transporter permease n=2 Tax=Pseudochryseolinea flava TaxID=2059302 RepID=A0A364XWP8_9BACT|nr:ABC transporter permease [Pseudochryseolinea flava]
MFRNYLTIAFRNLNKHRFFSAINIVGLAIGVAACLIITLFILQELSYDRHFANADRIYRLDAEIKFNGNHHRLAVMPAPTAAAMQSDFPEVEASMHFRQSPWKRVKRTTENFKEQFTGYASNGIFKVFSIPLLKGNTANALTEPRTLVISKSMADKYFPNEEALGQTLIVDNQDLYKITGIFQDLPTNTHFKLDFILSMEGLEESKANNWLSNNFNTYVLLREGNTEEALEAKFPKFVNTYVGPQIKEFLGADVTMEKFSANGDKLEYSLTPLLDIHLHSDLTAEMAANSDITYVYLFGAIALFILAIACINFMNLSTARSANRAKEVGVRKALGSLRAHLVRQFLMESIMLSVVSFVIALMLAYVALPGFNILAERNLSIPFSEPVFIATFVVMSLFVGVLAGLYPSLFLSAFRPVNVLKGKLSLGMKSGAVRSSLVVFQFMISIFLVVGTITVQKQLSFIQNTKIGFKKDQVVILHNTELLSSHDVLKNELLKYPGITNVSASGYIPISGWGRSNTSFWPEGNQPSQDNMVSMEYWHVDHDYVPTLGMQIKVGRNFSKDFLSDSTAIILNEEAVKRFGFKNPIGEKLSTFAVSNGTIQQDKVDMYTVVGVVENFHFESLKQNITPLCLQLGKSGWSVPIRFSSADTKAVLAHIEKSWKAVAPGQPFEYTFLDDAFGKMYSSEQQLGQIFAVFAGLAIIIACLGLFALTAFTAEQRTKEIGIRKVLGASVGSIVLLLSKEFGKLIIFAFLLAAPLSYLAVGRWLENYQYKTEIGIAVYILAGVSAFAVAWLTMGFQSIKAARGNPVSALRSE